MLFMHVLLPSAHKMPVLPSLEQPVLVNSIITCPAAEGERRSSVQGVRIMVRQAAEPQEVVERRPIYG